MASHPISITVINNEVGIPSTSDGVMMLFVQGYATSALALDTPYLLTQLSDATALGITASYDIQNNTAVYQHINEFYDGTLNNGALLWLVVTSPSNNFTNYCAGQTFQNCVQYTSIANPANRAKMIGFAYTAPQTVNTSANPFLADVLTAIPVIQAAQLAMFNEGYQWSALIDGNNMNANITAQNLPSCVTLNASSVSLCITGTQPNGVSGIGLALGRFARISVGHGFGAVADGAVTTNTAYLTNGVTIGENVISGTGGVLQVGVIYTVLNASIIYNGTTYQVGQSFTCISGHTSFTTSADGYVATGGTPVGVLTPAQVTALGNSQYLFLRTWFNQSGFYWNDGATCCATSLQLSSQEYNRVANALSADALAFFITQIGQNLQVNPVTGALNQSYLNALQGAFTNEYIAPYVQSGDISAAQIVVTGNNFNATKTLNFTLTIVPSPILSSVVGVIQFSSTL